MNMKAYRRAHVITRMIQRQIHLCGPDPYHRIFYRVYDRMMERGV